MKTRAQRAEARRRSGMPGAIVLVGTAKANLYGGLSYEQRVMALWELVQRVWRISGQKLPDKSLRSRLPGTVFRIENNG